MNEPWSIGFLSDGSYLITERGGRLLYFDQNGQSHTISGTPDVMSGGQAGLFDVLIPDDFATSNEIFLSYAHPDGLGTAVLAANFDAFAMSLTNPKQIFVMNSPSRSDIHFGARMLDDGAHILLTLGERGDRNLAQEKSVDNGKIIRIQKDGSGYTQYTMGHRNPQGLARDSQGQVFDTEHGAMGGDELNQIRAGQNYGWPIISYGLNYDGSKIGEGQAKEGLEQPRFYWDPSIAPSGLAIHDGANWPAINGLFFVGSLKFDQIEVLRQGAPFEQIDIIKTDETLRVRDVREAPDGTIWFLSVVNGAAYRISPIN